LREEFQEDDQGQGPFHLQELLEQHEEQDQVQIRDEEAVGPQGRVREKVLIFTYFL